MIDNNRSMNNRLHYTIIFLLITAISLTLGLADIREVAQQSGYHETIYADSVEPSSVGEQYIEFVNSDILMTGGVGDVSSLELDSQGRIQIKESGNTAATFGQSQTTISGDISVGQSVKSSKFCLGGDCVTSWSDISPSNPAYFSVSGASASSTNLNPGDSFTASATIQNTGDQSGTQTIDASVSGDSDSTTAILSSGQSTSESFSLTAPGSAGTYTVQICSEDECSTVSISVQSAPSPNPAYFNVFGASLSSASVNPGDSFSVSATVDNTGDQSDTQTVEATVSGDSSSSSVTLNGGSSTSESFSLSAPGSSGSYTVQVCSADSCDDTTLNVGTSPSPAYFQVSNAQTSTNSVTPDGSFTVTADIDNTGDQSDTQTVTSTVQGDSDSSSISLNGGEGAGGSFSLTAPSSEGTYTVDVSSADDSSTTSIVVSQTDPAYFDVSITGTNDPVVAGNAVSVTADIQNTGDQTGTKTISLSFNGNSNVDSTTETIAASSSKSVTLSHTPWSSIQKGLYGAVVSADGSDSTQVQIYECTSDSDCGSGDKCENNECVAKVIGQCGSADGDTYQCEDSSFTDTNWCAEGSPDKVPSFPGPGVAKSWTCVAEDGNSSRCTVGRNSCPIGLCGGRDGSASCTDDSWSDVGLQFCTEGTVDPSNPSFPSPGTSTSWKCTAAGGNASCQTTRDSCTITRSCTSTTYPSGPDCNNCGNRNPDPSCSSSPCECTTSYDGTSYNCKGDLNGVILGFNGGYECSFDKRNAN